MTELLAPAGSLDSVLAAIDAGADAIYLGGKLFNARKFAHNLDDAELERAVRTAHFFGIRIYVTVNIVLADTELEQVRTYLQFLDKLQTDGIIVQDLAVAALAREIVPSLPLHGSTQMTVADIQGVRQLEALGFTQVVLARELSLPEIKEICAQAKAKIEVFVHGASCMSYSGQCLMSSFIGGRSGNRGACAQPCRLPYELVGNEGKSYMSHEAYMLSLKDLNSTAYIDELMNAGVGSFKIEGRMKGSAYVRNVVQAYKGLMEAHDHSAQERQKARQEADAILAGSFNRACQADFLSYTIGRGTVTETAPGNQGQLVGTVERCRHNEAQALLKEPLEEGDMIKIVRPDGQSCIDEVQFVEAGVSVKGKKGYLLTLRRSDIYPGTLYRLARKADRSSREEGLKRRIPLYFHMDTAEDGCLRLTVWDEAGHAVEQGSNYTAPKASKRPATAAWLRSQLDRLGDTPFKLAEATLWDETYMIPASILNGMRREAIEKLEMLMLQEYERPQASACWPAPAPVVSMSTDPATMELAVRCDSLASVEAAAKAGADRIIFGGDSYGHERFVREDWKQAVAIAHEAGAALWAASPRILRQSQVPAMEAELLAAVEAGADGFYAGALGAFPLLSQVAAERPVEADWSLNIFNSTAVEVFADMGCSGVTLSPELTLRQIKYITRHTLVPIEVLVQGRLEMMITEFCSITAFAGKGCKNGCPGACRGKGWFLKDRRAELFPVVTDQYCRNHILNSRDLDMAPYYDDLLRAGIKRLRLEGRGRNPQWIARETARYRRLCDGTETLLLGKEDRTVTRGHYFHGIV